MRILLRIFFWDIDIILKIYKHIHIYNYQNISEFIWIYRSKIINYVNTLSKIINDYRLTSISNLSPM